MPAHCHCASLTTRRCREHVTHYLAHARQMHPLVHNTMRRGSDPPPGGGARARASWPEVEAQAQKPTEEAEGPADEAEAEERAGENRRVLGLLDGIDVVPVDLAGQVGKRPSKVTCGALSMVAPVPPAACCASLSIAAQAGCTYTVEGRGGWWDAGGHPTTHHDPYQAAPATCLPPVPSTPARLPGYLMNPMRGAPNTLPTTPSIITHMATI